MRTIQNDNHSKKGILFIFFISLIGLWYLNNILPVTKYFWYIGSGIIGIIFIKKNKSNTKVDVVVGIILGILVCITNPPLGVSTLFSYIGAQSVFRNTDNKIRVLYKDGNKNKAKDLIQTIFIVLLIGGTLGIFNVFIGLQNMPININNDFKWAIVALGPGIGEEVVFRFILFAVCIVITKDKVLTKGENILCYFIIVIPHVLLHFKLTNIDIGGIVILSVFFGAPFALLQRKYNLASAIGSHYLVDIIRFLVFAA